MYFFKIIIIQICLLLKLLNAELLVCDNNECKHASLLRMDSFFAELRMIIEGNRNTTYYLQELNKRIDNKIETLTTEVENIKEILNKQTININKRLAALQVDDSDTENEYSLYDDLWIIVQKRHDGSIDFYRNWTEYKNGFGNDVGGEFFVGLDKIHELTNDRDHELLVLLENFDGITKYAHYDHFLISNETDRFRLLKLGKYSGTLGNYLKLHLNMFFSTKDSDNDYADEGNCAEWFKGAWWYYHCMTSNLNGRYSHSPNLTESERGIGITWGSYDDILFSYKSSQIMLRAKDKNRENKIKHY
ncbi:hypothetical protein FF38_11089 [Lucilia cuprina]|uniref:Fibrinogen C-terminal domain-containing protein n=1 Tax=Lucilia cuprina TaxID=7375 RepID=A0A0L0CGU4_LUCCU|nr:hypothetical protein FF38_11089 [Lucilia cuprina]